MEILIYKNGSDFPEILPLESVDAIVVNDGKSIYDAWINPKHKNKEVKNG